MRKSIFFKNKKSSTIALDIGGSFVSIYLENHGLLYKEPSLITVRKSGDKYKIIAFGNDAKKYLAVENHSEYLTFSPVSHGAVKSDDYLSLYLKNAFEKIGISNLNKYNYLISISCGTTKAELKDFESSLKKTGIKHFDYIQSPICCALSLENPTSQVHLIVDIGGSKTDVAVVDSNKIVLGATLGLGGRAIDNSIKSSLKDVAGIEIDDISVETIKEQIGSLLENDKLSVKVRGVDLTNNMPREINISSNQLFPFISPYFFEILKVVQATVLEISEELQDEVIREGIVLCGATSSITGLATFIQTQLGMRSFLHPHHENAVILGLAKL